MDPVMLQEHLAQAERHVSEGERNATQQRELIARLERDGCDTGEARRQLRQLEAWLALHIEDRDRLRKELGF
jgi:hypothetical protein